MLTHLCHHFSQKWRVFHWGVSFLRVCFWWSWCTDMPGDSCRRQFTSLLLSSLFFVHRCFKSNLKTGQPHLNFQQFSSMCQIAIVWAMPRERSGSSRGVNPFWTTQPDSCCSGGLRLPRTLRTKRVVAFLFVNELWWNFAYWQLTIL